MPAPAAPRSPFALETLFTPAALRHLGLVSLDTLWNVFKIVLLFLLLRFLLSRLVNRVLTPILLHGSALMEDGQAGRIKTLAGLINSIIGYTLVFIFGVMLLRAFGMDPVPLLTTASVAGLAIGFGAQKLVKDVISGFFILLENQYTVGEYVTIGAVTGTVEMVGMRTTRIRDDAGRLFMISNGDISQVCNQSRGAVATFVEIGIAPTSDLAKATEIINSAGEDLLKAQPELGLAQAPTVQGLGAMDAAKLTLRVGCPVTAPAHLEKAQIALRGLAHQRLVVAGIALA